ncbi:MAG: serine hydrolase domain-containing protein, partial [Bacillota bacterium]|nr:serine hydrolase domain-containing protein [Bacillota bacterium]
DDPISKYIPNFPNGKRIELIHLLTHTSGIQRPIWHKEDSTTTDLMKEIENRKVHFRAGSKWDYQDANYMVLGYILEKVTGISLQDYIQKNIFDKANMVDSGFITSSLLTPISSVGYLKDGKSFNPIRVYNAKLLFGCGDIYSTANDLALFDQALIHGKLVSYPSLKEMLVPGSASTYGMGLYNKGNVIFSHGNLGGFEAIHSFYKDGTSIAILLNVRDTSVNIFKTLSGIHQILITMGKTISA